MSLPHKPPSSSISREHFTEQPESKTEENLTAEINFLEHSSSVAAPFSYNHFNGFLVESNQQEWERC